MHSITRRCLVLFTFAVAGCGSSPPPAYVAPTDPATSCLLIGENGAYIQQVNGATVASGLKIDPSVGGNEVRCPAGALRLKVYVSSHEGSAQWTFFVNTDPGVTYLVHRSDRASLNVDIVDRVTGKKINVD